MPSHALTSELVALIKAIQSGTYTGPGSEDLYGGALLPVAAVQRSALPSVAGFVPGQMVVIPDDGTNPGLYVAVGVQGDVTADSMVGDYAAIGSHPVPIGVGSWGAPTSSSSLNAQPAVFGQSGLCSGATGSETLANAPYYGADLNNLPTGPFGVSFNYHHLGQELAYRNQPPEPFQADASGTVSVILGGLRVDFAGSEHSCLISYVSAFGDGSGQLFRDTSGLPQTEVTPCSLAIDANNVLHYSIGDHVGSTPALPHQSFGGTIGFALHDGTDGEGNYFPGSTVISDVTFTSLGSMRWNKITTATV